MIKLEKHKSALLPTFNVTLRYDKKTDACNLGIGFWKHCTYLVKKKVRQELKQAANTQGFLFIRRYQRQADRTDRVTGFI